jgi:inorganic pyrophosphatase
VSEFFALLDRLVEESTVTVERPRGRPHPRIPDAVYPVDYGRLDHTTSADGAELDVFVGTAAGRGVVGVLLTADLVKRDAELKILVDCTADEVRLARHFCAEVLEIGGQLVERGGGSLRNRL